MYKSIKCYNLIVFKNCFVYTDYDRITKEYKEFKISSYCNEYDDFINYLYENQQALMVGFNNINYHYPLLHNIIFNLEAYKFFSSEMLTHALYTKSEELLSGDFNAIPNKDVHIKQCDVFKIFHWDNLKKSCSIKKCQIAFNFPDISDCEVKNQITRESDISKVSEFNKRTVDTIVSVLDCAFGITDNDLYKGRNEIALRIKLSEKYRLNLMNHSKVKLAEDIIVKSYAKREDIPWDKLKEMGTQRPIINIKDCIPSDINFKSKEFNNLIERWSKKVIYTGNEEKDEKIVYKGLSIATGNGGVHAAKSGIFKSCNDYFIVHIDGTSYYPTIVNARRIKPAHMKDSFFSIYDSFRLERIAQLAMPNNLQDKLIIEGNKLIISSIFGKLNHEKSPLYDPLAFMKITIAGQLQILKLVEMIYNIDDAEVLNINTDGIICKIPVSKKEEYIKVKHLWEKLFNISLTELMVDKLFTKDVSNYLLIDCDGKIHDKGVFRINKLINENNGGKIISIALHEYFINGKPVMETLTNHKNIYDFCLTSNVKSETLIIYKTIDGNGINEEIVGRTARYYIGGYKGALVTQNKGSSTQKKIADNRSVVLFNKLFKSDNYKIDYQYYYKEVIQIIDSVEDRQLCLF